MYNLYLKGLSTDNQELNEIRSLFKKHGLDFTVVFEGYGNLPIKSDEELKVALQDKLRERNPMGQKINLICHSMGCNLGLLAAEDSKKIKSLVLISPEFGEYSEKELKQIEKDEINLNKPRAYGEQEIKINKNNIRSLLLFRKTKLLATAAIEKVDVPTLIIYSKDDAFIPKEYLNDLAERKDNIQVATIPTKYHNPLINGKYKTRTMRLIKKNIK